MSEGPQYPKNARILNSVIIELTALFGRVTSLKLFEATCSCSLRRSQAMQGWPALGLKRTVERNHHLAARGSKDASPASQPLNRTTLC